MSVVAALDEESSQWAASLEALSVHDGSFFPFGVAVAELDAATRASFGEHADAVNVLTVSDVHATMPEPMLRTKTKMLAQKKDKTGTVRRPAVRRGNSRAALRAVARVSAGRAVDSVSADAASSAAAAVRASISDIAPSSASSLPLETQRLIARWATDYFETIEVPVSSAAESSAVQAAESVLVSAEVSAALSGASPTAFSDMASRGLPGWGDADWARKRPFRADAPPARRAIGLAPPELIGPAPTVIPSGLAVAIFCADDLIHSPASTLDASTISRRADMARRTLLYNPAIFSDVLVDEYLAQEGVKRDSDADVCGGGEDTAAADDNNEGEEGEDGDEEANGINAEETMDQADGRELSVMPQSDASAALDVPAPSLPEKRLHFTKRPGYVHWARRPGFKSKKSKAAKRAAMNHTAMDSAHASNTNRAAFVSLVLSGKCPQFLAFQADDPQADSKADCAEEDVRHLPSVKRLQIPSAVYFCED